MSELHNVLGFALSNGRKLLASHVPTSSPPGQQHLMKRPSSYLNKAALDSDLVIILSVLLSFLCLALGLTSLIRCLVRCREQTLPGSSDGVADTGLKKAVLKALPIIVYSATSNAGSVAADCPICLAEFGEGEKMRVLPKCNHGFHVECIDNWLVSHLSCPMCRLSLNLESGNEEPGGSALSEAIIESNNIMHIVIEAADLFQAAGLVSPHTETFQRTPH